MNISIATESSSQAHCSEKNSAGYVPNRYWRNSNYFSRNQHNQAMKTKKNTYLRLPSWRWEFKVLQKIHDACFWTCPKIFCFHPRKIYWSGMEQQIKREEVDGTKIVYYARRSRALTCSVKPGKSFKNENLKSRSEKLGKWVFVLESYGKLAFSWIISK